MRLRLAALFLVVSTVAHADPRPRHVYVSGLSDGDVSLVVSAAGDDPVGVVAGGEVIAPPRGGDLRDDEAMLRSAPDPAASSAPANEMRPDRLTGTVSATDYFEAFTPAVAPYKRSMAYDGIRLDRDGTPVLVVAEPAREPVAILGTNPPAAGPRDAFWGTAMLDFRRGPSIAIPSVAGSARILHVRTEPAIDFILETDSAGNFYAHALEPGAGIVRLTFLTDAPRGFFQRTIPAQRTDALAAQVAPVPESVRARGLHFASSLGISPGTAVDHTLSVLVAHFRSFVEADEIPSPTGDVYLDLARGGVGVCRHRAYAFVVTALSLGLPARYVQNEAHAWVEVGLRDGWLRIDLGGSASGVNAHGLQDRPKHEVAALDPFPQPEIYVRDYLERGVAPEPAPRPSAVPGQGQGQGAEGSATSSGDARGATPSTNAANPSPESQAQNATNPSAPSEEMTGEASTNEDPQASVDPRIGTRIALDASSHRVYRGQMLDLAGRLVDAEGRSVVGGRIEVRLGGGRLLGVALTEEEGRFRLSLGIPPDLGVGRHPIQVGFVGDGSRSPSFAP